MSKTVGQSLSGISLTSLAPLYWRAIESLRPDAIIRDERAVELVNQLQLDFSQVKRIKMNELLNAMRIIFTREFDQHVRDFLDRYPVATVVQIGCGFDSRFERVDNGDVVWYDLDLPDVIELRQKLLTDENERHHLLACSVFDDSWMEVVKVHSSNHCLFLAETVFVYFKETQVRSLVQKLRNKFPGAELVFDGWKPFEIWLSNRYLSASQFSGCMQWGIWNARTIEGWGEGIRLLSEWGFFDQPEPRLHSFRWMAPLFHLAKPMCIFHFILGKARE